jgi:hypothetical protein
VRGLLALTASLLLIASAAFAGCGDDSSNGKGSNAKTSTAARQGSANREGGGTSGPGAGARRRRHRSGQGEASGGFRGVNSSVYAVARSVCAHLGVADAARRYQVESKRPIDVARAYARREYKVPRLQPAATKGCLAGFKRH